MKNIKIDHVKHNKFYIIVTDKGTMTYVKAKLDIAYNGTLVIEFFTYEQYHGDNYFACEYDIIEIFEV